MKILVLTSIYVGDDIPKEFTPIVHYFTSEWVKMGHEVIVVHNLAYYPRFFYLISFFFSKLIASLTGTNIPKKRLSNEKEYLIDYVKVYRIPMFKFFPHIKFSKNIIKNQITNILKKLSNHHFKPDFIIGHWSNPQLELINSLKLEFSDAKSVLVMHDSGESILKLYNKESFKLIDSIDVFGFRSSSLKIKFDTIFGKKEDTFMCYSGIPMEFTEGIVVKKFQKDLSSFLFVGTLIKRKHPIKILNALLKVYSNSNFSLNYIGEGNELKKINSIIKNEKIECQVKINGFLQREEVRTVMLESDCFIMISENEAFGLVYLEAMSAGCITIASRGEGFDGVIEHGNNGFLCEAGNDRELADLIKKINSLSEDEKIRISKNAILTAKKLTNFNAAKLYLNHIGCNENNHYHSLLQ